MSTIVTVRAWYPGRADAIFEAACRFSEMAEAMEGFAVYEGIDHNAVAQSGQQFVVNVTFFGVIRMKGHRIDVEEVSREHRFIQSRESGNGIRHWDHRLSVEETGDGALWTDRVEIDAGWQTWFVSRFAAYMYRRRHRHRRATSIETQYLAV